MTSQTLASCRRLSSTTSTPRRFAVGLVLLFAVVACGESDSEHAASTTAPEPTTIDGLIESTPQSAPPVATQPPASQSSTPDQPSVSVPVGSIELLKPEIIESFPHDITAYTQGLELFGGDLLESTGRQGHPGGAEVYESDLRRVDLASGEVLQRADVPGTVFAEGLTRVEDQLIQLTWKDQVAYYWDAHTFEVLKEVSYDGQGWGLCFDGERLVMSDGSPTLFFRDPSTFELIGQVVVTQSGSEISLLNELECIDGRVWANIYTTDFVVRVDPTTGFVDGVVDASNLEQPRDRPTEVLNGIAWDAETETWLMTGKFWPTMYRVQFVPDGFTN